MGLLVSFAIIFTNPSSWKKDGTLLLIFQCNLAYFMASFVSIYLLNQQLIYSIQKVEFHQAALA